MLKYFIQAYNRSYHNHPLITLACVNGILASTSDTLAQSIILLKSSSSDKKRWYFSKPPPKTFTDKVIEKIDQTLPAPHHENLIPDKVSPNVSGGNKFDFARLGRFTSYGFIIAPIIHTWYSFLDKRFPLPTVNSNFPGSIKIRQNTLQTMKIVFKRVVVDQTMFAPFGVFLFFGIIGVLERQEISKIKQKLEEV
ncbi:11932_t:CDS:1 [Acaulospora colombiana]|uniref:11932_t:CDS:1 n=1 Tax=Acaulospora colombiana TaxID=27376 RepID=A0ACA9LUV0_9GLOM|nr:11932_t:CDS:1 [Acaulospora colombiana]